MKSWLDLNVTCHPPLKSWCAWVKVTPAMAGDWLEKNIINRPIRPKWVTYLAEQITLGKFYRCTSAVGFREDGVLVNGQHRLLAILKAGVAVELLVATGMQEDSFHIEDRGSQRTVGDALGLPEGIVADAALISRTIEGNMGTTRVSEEVTRDVVDWWRPVHEELGNYGPVTRNLGGSPIRIAFGLRWGLTKTVEGRGELLAQFGALSTGKIDLMYPSTAHLWKRLQKENVRGSSSERRLAIVKAYVATDPARRSAETYVKFPDPAIQGLQADLIAMQDAFTEGPAEDGHPYKFPRRRG